MAWVGPAISGAASIAGGLISSSGQSATNAANFANTEKLLSQTEAYDTQMSNTAMTRRVQDLKNAGLNPLLAVSQGGASTPTVSPNSPTLGSPGAALGAGVSQAGASAAQVVQNEGVLAQAAKDRASAKQIAGSTVDPADTSAKLQADTSVSLASAGQMQQQTQNLGKQFDEIGARIDNLESQTKGQNISNATNQALQSLTVQMQALQVQMQRLGMPVAQAKADVATRVAAGIPSSSGLAAVGDYIGNKAADLHDALSDWWNSLAQSNAAVLASHRRSGQN